MADLAEQKDEGGAVVEAATNGRDTETTLLDHLDRILDD